jgi:hypothetical protein
VRVLLFAGVALLGGAVAIDELDSVPATLSRLDDPVLERGKQPRPDVDAATPTLDE